jgi:hypothetical protein
MRRRQLSIGGTANGTNARIHETNGVKGTNERCKTLNKSKNASVRLVVYVNIVHEGISLHFLDSTSKVSISALGK